MQGHKQNAERAIRTPKVEAYTCVTFERKHELSEQEAVKFSYVRGVRAGLENSGFDVDNHLRRFYCIWDILHDRS